MEKTKYRYKCMTCGTEEITSDEMLSCCACGSDELAKFDVTPFVDITEKKPEKKPRQKKRKPREIEISLTPDVDSILTGISMSTPSRSTPSPHISIPRPPPPPPPQSIWKRAYSMVKKPVKAVLGGINWKITKRIAIPLAIGAVVYGILSIFI